MLLYACISAHGYGHGSRTTAVLAELHRLQPDCRLVLSTALPQTFLQLALGEVPFEHRPCRWDVGVSQADALGVDAAATEAALLQLEAALPAQLEREAAWLRLQPGPVLVLGDVPPAAAALAQQVEAPLVWLASFGWDAIYGPMGGGLAERVASYRRAYGQGALLLRCPLHLPMPWGIPEVAVGLTCSRPRLPLAALAADLRLPAERQRCVLISFGGLGLPLDPAWLQRWPELVFIGPDPALAGEANGRTLPAGVRPLDLMPLVGRLLTKAGYSTFCEAFSQGVGVHLVARSGFAEAPVLERDLQRHGWHRLLSQEQFASGAWDLDQPLQPPSAGPLATDGALQAARELQRLLER